MHRDSIGVCRTPTSPRAAAESKRIPTGVWRGPPPEIRARPIRSRRYESARRIIRVFPESRTCCRRTAAEPRLKRIQIECHSSPHRIKLSPSPPRRVTTHEYSNRSARFRFPRLDCVSSELETGAAFDWLGTGCGPAAGTWNAVKGRSSWSASERETV